MILSVPLLLVLKMLLILLTVLLTVSPLLLISMAHSHSGSLLMFLVSVEAASIIVEYSDFRSRI